MIGFLDAGTGRLFLHVVLCNKGEGVRQDHVNAAFIAMAMDPAWGFPRALYLDNGSEFGGLDKLQGAMALLSAPGARTIIRARPYNASAKPVESHFARLDRQFICILPGYAGKDRMTKKTQTVGKPPAPYPHSLERFVEDIRLGVDDLNAKTMGGQWAGRSPLQMLETAIVDGWRPVLVPAEVIDAAFCDFDQRRVGKGGYLRIGGKCYPVAAVATGTTVNVALPWRPGADPLYRTPGALSWTHLAEDMVLPADFPEGAEESGRRQKAGLRTVRQLDKGAPDVDPMDYMRHRARKRVAAFLPKPGPVLDVGSQLTTLGDEIAKGGDVKAAELSEEQRRRLQRDRTTERLNRSLRNG